MPFEYDALSSWRSGSSRRQDLSGPLDLEKRGSRILSASNCIRSVEYALREYSVVIELV